MFLANVGQEIPQYELWNVMMIFCRHPTGNPLERNV